MCCVFGCVLLSSQLVCLHESSVNILESASEKLSVPKSRNCTQKENRQKIAEKIADKSFWGTEKIAAIPRRFRDAKVRKFKRPKKALIKMYLLRFVAFFVPFSGKKQRFLLLNHDFACVTHFCHFLGNAPTLRTKQPTKTTSFGDTPRLGKPL